MSGGSFYFNASGRGTYQSKKFKVKACKVHAVSRIPSAYREAIREYLIAKVPRNPSALIRFATTDIEELIDKEIKRRKIVSYLMRKKEQEMQAHS